MFKNLMQTQITGTTAALITLGTAIGTSVISSKLARSRQQDGKEPMLGLFF